MWWAQNLICPALLLDSLDLTGRRQLNKYWHVRSFFVCVKELDMCSTVPDRSSKQRVKGIQPVMHLLVITGLKEYPTMLCAYRKCVGGLQFRQTLGYSSVDLLENKEKKIFADVLPSAWPAGLRCTPLVPRTG